MLNKPVEEIVMEDGHVVGVKSEGEVTSQQASLMYLFGMTFQNSVRLVLKDNTK